VLIGMNQQTLAARLGVTFQQVQKYERGDNRVSASRLARAADLLGIDVDYFFDGYTSAELSKAQELERQLWEEPETLELVRHYCAIPDPTLRARFLDLAKAAEGADQ
jgi:transcriptional regulator with XRE-family HTH domain